MSETPKKQSFLHGTVLLAAATAIVKVIGALYKIPLGLIIGDDGFSYFDTAYQIYSLLLLISTAGLPVAMSRMISQASSAGQTNQVRRIYRTARWLFLALGIVGALFMTFGCNFLAQWLGQENSVYAIACLGPCVLLICMISTYRGFFQGHGNMIPTSVSQVLEAIVKLIVGIGLALLVVRQTGNIPMAAGGAILGVTVSCVASVIYLLIGFRKSYRRLPESHDTPLSYKETTRQLLSIAVPITIGVAGLQLLTVLENGIYVNNLNSLLRDGTYTSPLIEQLKQQILQNNPTISLEKLQNNVVDNIKGIYNKAQTVYNLPVAFITPITISIIPAITAHLTRHNEQDARSTAESAVRITGLISMPCAVGLVVLSAPIMSLLYAYSGERLELAACLMGLLGVCVVFNSLVLLTNAIMQAHGHATLPVINMFIGGIVKLVAVYVLTANPHIGIYGVPIGSLLCYIVITVLNLLTMRKSLPSAPAVLRNIGRSFLAAAIMGIFAYGCYFVMTSLLDIHSRLLVCGIPIAVGTGVYFVAAIKLKAITHEDCLLLPKGDKLAKILKL